MFESVQSENGKVAGTAVSACVSLTMKPVRRAELIYSREGAAFYTHRVKPFKRNLESMKKVL
jgi:hypothetical protein